MGNGDAPAVMDGLRDRLELLLAREGGVGLKVRNFGGMQGGHAGLTFGFDAIDPEKGSSTPYILKLAPPGVARRGNTDVFRQARLLRALKVARMPVPGVPWAAAEDEVLGTAFMVMQRLPGDTFLAWGEQVSGSRTQAEVRSRWIQLAQVLARIHRFNWRMNLPSWDEPATLANELWRWVPTLQHAQQAEWLSAGAALHDALGDRMPSTYETGLVHGDFHPGNVLFENGAVTGVIDWELACIGPQGVDLGWLLMMVDPAAWAQDWRPLAPVSKEEILAAYREAGGPAAHRIAWFQALAHFRFGSIACWNVKLHRTGKRPDPWWERFEGSIARLFQSGADLLKADAAA